MTIKVANIIEDGRFGGPQARILSVAEKQKDLNIETTAFLPMNNSVAFYDKLKKSGIKTCQLTLNHLSRNKANLIRYFFLFPSEICTLRQLLKKGGFDVVQCNGAWQIKGLIAGKMARQKVIWHLNDTRKSKIIVGLFRTLVNYFCDGLILQSNRVKEHYCSESILAAKPYIIIQASVDTTHFLPSSVSSEKDAKKGDNFDIITVANINPAKGLEYFIEMAGILNSTVNNLRFFIIGNLFENQIPYYEKLSALLKKYQVDNLFFKHGVYDVREFLHKADIYVCSSMHEASPTALWEAMAMSKPIVATDVADVAEFIENGENGFVVEPGNSKALATKVELLIKDMEIRNKFAMRVRKVVIENHDIDICAKKHYQIYRAVCNS